MSQLSGLLTMVPLTITPDVINDFLTKRKNGRREISAKSGSAANPDLVAPISGEWTGTCKECRTCYGDEQQITYRLLFKPCGAVEGSGSSPDGKFLVKGVYDMLKGTVAWRQSSPHAASSCEYGSKLTAEFVGDLILAHWPSQQAAIVGTFLTTGGGYYNVELRDPETAFQPRQKKSPLPLPTLLTGGCTPKGAGTPARFYCKRSDPSLAEEIDSKSAQKAFCALDEFRNPSWYKYFRTPTPN